METDATYLVIRLPGITYTQMTEQMQIRLAQDDEVCFVCQVAYEQRSIVREVSCLHRHAFHHGRVMTHLTRRSKLYLLQAQLVQTSKPN